jgi:hypothetical protein
MLGVDAQLSSTKVLVLYMDCYLSEILLEVAERIDALETRVMALEHALMANRSRPPSPRKSKAPVAGERRRRAPR